MEPSLGPSGKLKTARKGVGRFSVIVDGGGRARWPRPGGGCQRHPGALVPDPGALRPQRSSARNDGERRHHRRGPRALTSSRRRAGPWWTCGCLQERTPAAWRRRILGLKPVTPGVRLRVEGGMGRPPMERTPRNRRLWETARELGKELGLDLEEGVAGGGL